MVSNFGDCRIGGQGFEFLGYRFEAGKRWVRKKSPTALKDKVRMFTRRTRVDSLGRIIADLNPMLKGWHGNFKPANERVLSDTGRAHPTTAGEPIPMRTGKPMQHAIWNMKLTFQFSGRFDFHLARFNTIAALLSIETASDVLKVTSTRM